MQLTTENLSNYKRIDLKNSIAEKLGYTVHKIKKDYLSK